MNSWRVRFRNFQGNSPVHYAALFINRTINNNYMTLPMALHHTLDEFWYFFLDATRATHIPGILSTLNLPIKSHLSSGYLRFSWGNFSVKLLYLQRKDNKITTIHSLYGGQIPPRKVQPPLLAVCLKKYIATRIPI